MIHQTDYMAILVDYNFDNVKCTKEEYTKLRGRDKGFSHNDVKKFVVGYYDSGDLSINAYQHMFQKVTKEQDLIAWEILVQGIYYNDRDNPDYAVCLRYGARYAKYDFFLHILHAYATYNKLDDDPAIMYDVLLKLAKRNPDTRVYQFLKQLEKLLTQHNSYIYLAQDPDLLFTYKQYYGSNNPIPEKVLVLTEEFAEIHLNDIKTLVNHQ